MTLSPSCVILCHLYYWFDVGNYMVFYVVMDDVMEVRRFLYGARDLTRMIP